MKILNEIYKLNRSPALSSWFKKQLSNLVEAGYYSDDIIPTVDSLVDQLIQYRLDYKINEVVIGISGGIDSAVTASLFKRAGYNVLGVTMPIFQEQAETNRGVEFCEALDIEHLQVDLGVTYDMLINSHAALYDKYLITGTRKTDLIRRGNIRARLRMMVLYDLANMRGGFVGSTDNFSELAAGFWTLHGDVGDVAPIQSLTKSWEIPRIAQYLGIPDSIVNAVPTDGLGIANGDEDQLGFSYLEFDIVLLTLLDSNVNYNKVLSTISNEKDRKIFSAVADRIRLTEFKRKNPFNLEHPIHGTRFDNLAELDKHLTNIAKQENTWKL